MQNFLNALEKVPSIKQPWAWGLALIHRGQMDDNIIYYDFISVNFNDNAKSFSLIAHTCGFKDSVQIIDQNALTYLATEAFSSLDDTHLNAKAIKAAHKHNRSLALVALFEDVAPKNNAEVFLKLHLLSKTFTKPRSINLSNAFSLLENLAWDEQGKPWQLAYLKEHEAELKCANLWPNITMIDKFPRYLQTILPPKNVRILDASKVRLGAHLAEGTTIMPGASYVNFNAGTLGAAMVEGRISSSAIVGANSDIGGGASILGVLSGTDGTPISVGERCLLGANSVTGICLGDDCVVDASVAALSGAKAKIINAAAIMAANAGANLDLKDEQIIKLGALSGLNALHIRQDSQSGQLLVKHNTKAIKLNQQLH